MNNTRTTQDNSNTKQHNTTTIQDETITTQDKTIPKQGKTMQTNTRQNNAIRCKTIQYKKIQQQYNTI